MLKASFPNIRCINGHPHPYGESECPKCHQLTDLPKLSNETFCQCGMIRPEIIESRETRMIVHHSHFCFWCGKFFDEPPYVEEPLFSY